MVNNWANAQKFFNRIEQTIKHGEDGKFTPVTNGTISMAGDRYETAEKQTLAQAPAQSEATLSQCSQILFKPLAQPQSKAEPPSIDFGNAANLYHRKDNAVAQLHWDMTGEVAGYGHRPKEFPEPVRGSKPFVDTGKITEPTDPSTWTFPTRDNYSGWVAGDPINPMTWAKDSSLYIQEIMKQNFVVSDGKRLPMNDATIDKDFKYRFGNAARHALGIGDLVFNHGFDASTAENGMWWHEPPGLANSLVKSATAGSWEPFNKEKADSDADLKNNHYAASKVSSFSDFDSFARQMLTDSWKSASKGSWVIDTTTNKN